MGIILITLSLITLHFENGKAISKQTLSKEQQALIEHLAQLFELEQLEAESEQLAQTELTVGEDNQDFTGLPSSSGFAHSKSPLSGLAQVEQYARPRFETEAKAEKLEPAPKQLAKAPTKQAGQAERAPATIEKTAPKALAKAKSRARLKALNKSQKTKAYKQQTVKEEQPVAQAQTSKQAAVKKSSSKQVAKTRSNYRKSKTAKAPKFFNSFQPKLFERKAVAPSAVPEELGKVAKPTEQKGANKSKNQTTKEDTQAPIVIVGSGQASTAGQAEKAVVKTGDTKGDTKVEPKQTVEAVAELGPDEDLLEDIHLMIDEVAEKQGWYFEEGKIKISYRPNGTGKTVDVATLTVDENSEEFFVLEGVGDDIVEPDLHNAQYWGYDEGLKDALGENKTEKAMQWGRVGLNMMNDYREKQVELNDKFIQVSSIGHNMVEMVLSDNGPQSGGGYATQLMVNSDGREVERVIRGQEIYQLEEQYGTEVGRI